MLRHQYLVPSPPGHRDANRVSMQDFLELDMAALMGMVLASIVYGLFSALFVVVMSRTSRRWRIRIAAVCAFALATACMGLQIQQIIAALHGERYAKWADVTVRDIYVVLNWTANFILLWRIYTISPSRTLKIYIIPAALMFLASLIFGLLSILQITKRVWVLAFRASDLCTNAVLASNLVLIFHTHFRSAPQHLLREPIFFATALSAASSIAFLICVLTGSSNAFPALAQVQVFAAMLALIPPRPDSRRSETDSLPSLTCSPNVRTSSYFSDCVNVTVSMPPQAVVRLSDAKAQELHWGV
ncbi:hypothetical protein EVG20_g5723 [Dentipellis fragilis]|uniref:Uncharacterized protein n=1 Tax=Dentipellis fragilis TaxID=205917 RepID=A0A4Y9YR72_9AGAM|nr:hypothetical protein EVG20_g5723 [Dentipellis fragilis]